MMRPTGGQPCGFSPKRSTDFFESQKIPIKCERPFQIFHIKNHVSQMPCFHNTAFPEPSANHDGPLFHDERMRNFRMNVFPLSEIIRTKRHSIRKFRERGTNNSNSRTTAARSMASYSEKVIRAFRNQCGVELPPGPGRHTGFRGAVTCLRGRQCIFCGSLPGRYTRRGAVKGGRGPQGVTRSGRKSCGAIFKPGRSHAPHSIRGSLIR